MGVDVILAEQLRYVLMARAVHRVYTPRRNHGIGGFGGRENREVVARTDRVWRAFQVLRPRRSESEDIDDLHGTVPPPLGEPNASRHGGVEHGF